jgi:ABC-type phosphate transport system permease subunit
MTPMVSFFLRFVLMLVVMVLLASLSEDAFAATPIPQAVHDALDAMGPQASHIAGLWNVFMWACAAFFAAIVLALL